MKKSGPDPKCVWCISGSRSPSWFFVELGAEMIVASTIVPRDRLRPFFCKTLPTSSKIFLPRSFFSSIWRNRIAVVSSGTGSRPRSMPTNGLLEFYVPPLSRSRVLRTFPRK